jgi:hypothetical protein
MVFFGADCDCFPSAVTAAPFQRARARAALRRAVGQNAKLLSRIGTLPTLPTLPRFEIRLSAEGGDPDAKGEMA